MKVRCVYNLAAEPRIAAYINKAAGNYLYDSLGGRCDPEIALKIRGDHFDPAFQSQIRNYFKGTILIKVSEGIYRGNPYPAAVIVEPVDICQRINGYEFHGIGRLTKEAVIDHITFRTKVQFVRIFGVGQDRGYRFRSEIFAVVNGRDVTVFYLEDLAALCLAVDAS